MIGQNVSHYKVVDKLGAGGMGEVFLAEDTRHGRKVALKILAAEHGSDEDSRRRFTHEAMAQARLSHPHVVTFYEVGEDSGKVFIAMEYIDGQSLAETIRTRELTPDEAIDLGIQIGDALQAAHDADVIHRDMKPDNVLISTSGHAKITDFGLARWKGATTITKTGTLLGTPHYMSPEQAAGRKLDRRSDLFSFGVILYELLCQRRPFEGDHDAVVLHDISYSDPQPLARYARAIPPELERIVLKALAKDPTLRYQSAADLVADLRALTPGVHRTPARGRSPIRRRRALFAAVAVMLLGIAGTAYILLSRSDEFLQGSPDFNRKVLAVLPFENLGGLDEDYFVDGMTGEITSQVAKLSGIGVISRTSARLYKNSEKPLQQIASELGADYVLEGTIAWDRSGDVERVRISPQLIRVTDDTHVWTNSYNRPLTDVFLLQAEIARHLASVLGIVLQPEESEALEFHATDDLEAFDLYLQANELYAGHNERPEGLREAAQRYRQAIALDSSFALAWVWLSRTYSLLWGYSREPSDLDSSNRALERALALNPELPDAIMAKAVLLYRSGAHDSALQIFNRVRNDLPNDPGAYFHIGMIRWKQGMPDLARENYVKAAELAPRSAELARYLADLYRWTRNYDSASKYFDKALILEPENSRPYLMKAWITLEQYGDVSSAMAAFKAASAHMQPTGFSQYVGAVIHVCAGDYDAALELFGSEALARAPGVQYTEKAMVYGLKGDSELEQIYYDSARVYYEDQLKNRPDDAPNNSGLGIAYAGLGRKEEAIASGLLAMKLAPVFENQTELLNLVNMARIYTMAGEFDAAIDQLEVLLSIPSMYSRPLLGVEPLWDPLRAEPRFQAMMAKEDKVFK